MVAGLKNAKRHIHNVNNFFESDFFTKAKKKMAEEVIKDIVRASAGGIQVGGGRFTKYSDAYDKFKAKKYPGSGFMIATGKAIGFPAQPKNFKYRVFRHKVDILYTGPDYMVYHQEGKGNNPKRKWFGLQRKSTLEGIHSNIKQAIRATAKAVSSGRKI